jgi:hypothetical protein
MDFCEYCVVAEKRTVSLRIFSKNAYFHSAYSLKTRYFVCVGVIENFEYLGEFEKDVQECWQYCVWHPSMI